MEFFREVTPLKQEDLCVVLDSSQNSFDYPLHNHPEYEINLVMGTSGTRIVGDSTELFKDIDLVLLGHYLPHKWEEDLVSIAAKKKYRVITIQFGIDLFSMSLLSKECFYRIKQMLENSRRGMQFEQSIILKAALLMIKLTERNKFQNVLDFMELLNLLSSTKRFKYLSSNIDASKVPSNENKRVQKAYNFIMMNYTRPNFMISEVAEELNLSNSAFSHFFKKHAFRNFSTFVIDLRLGHACKLLLSTDLTMSQISVKSGFNNISNFNRLFLKYKECTPKVFRSRYNESKGFDWSKQKTQWQFIPRKSSNSFILPDTYSTKINHV